MTLGPNLTGVAYSRLSPSSPGADRHTDALAHPLTAAKLAFFYLDKNPAKKGKALVVLGSMASFFGLAGGPIYCASKHACVISNLARRSQTDTAACLQGSRLGPLAGV